MSKFVRVLPVLGVCMLGLLALRVGEVWTGASAVGKAWAENAAKEKEHGETPQAKPATPVADEPLAPPADAKTDSGIPALNKPKAEEASDKAHDTSAEHAPGEEAHGDDKSEGPTAPARAARPQIPGEDAFVSPAEIQVLESLTRRREELDKRAAALDMREKLMQTTEQRLDQKLAEIRKVEDAIKASIRTLSDQEAAQIASLVKVYETMKPKDAAAILQGLDRKILIDVAQRMKEAKMSAVLAAMDPDKAREVTVLLATRTEIPGLGTTAAIGAKP
ncbi:MAG: hypothetical protein U1E87_06130 [Alphaproteobacteria bacterium]